MAELTARDWRRLGAVLDRLNDDTLAIRAAVQGCTDPRCEDFPRCMRCRERFDGIEDYRKAVMAETILPKEATNGDV